jgi:hypothetical protein
MLICSKRTFRNMRCNDVHISGSDFLSTFSHVTCWIAWPPSPRRSEHQTAHFAERNKDICVAWRKRQGWFNQKSVESIALRITLTCVWKEWLYGHAAGTKWREFCLQ